jgi:hypothetical protein
VHDKGRGPYIRTPARSTHSLADARHPELRFSARLTDEKLQVEVALA